MEGTYPRGSIVRSTHVLRPAADQKRVKLFGRDDDARAAAVGAKTNEHGTTQELPKSRLNEQCAKLREVHVELDDIEGRIASLREHQAAFRLKASTEKKRAKLGRVETVDLRSLADADVTAAQLVRARRARESQMATAESVSDSTSPSESRDTVADHDEDFDRRFAAFAAAGDDEMSRRWLDTD